jgi:Protein of unknown function (DUF3231).
MSNLSEVNQNNFEQSPFGVVQHNLSDVKPTASEIGHLWTSYLAESMSICMLKHIVANSKDPDIKPIIQQALNTSTEIVKSIEDLYNTIDHPIPIGFGENDVNANIPALFSESFGLAYTRLMNVYVQLHYVLALARSTRSDFRQLFSNAISTSTDIIEKATDVLLAKGLLPKAPSINIPDKIEKVNDKKYYGSFFGDTRTLNAVEISHLYHCIVLAMVYSTLKLGFSQVAKSKEIKNYLNKGSEIQREQAKILGDFLQKEKLPIPIPSEFQVTDSKQSPWSDKLILSHATVVTSYSITSYGFALTSSTRKDLIPAFSRLILEALEYSKSGADLMIKNGWLERIPETSDRQELLQ